MSDSTFFFGEWQVNPSANSLLLGKQVKQLEPKAMDVLLFLCQNAGEVVSSDEIVSHCWPGVDTGDNPLHKIINQLRRALGDSATESRYIETIRKRLGKVVRRFQACKPTAPTMPTCSSAVANKLARC